MSKYIAYVKGIAVVHCILLFTFLVRVKYKTTFNSGHSVAYIGHHISGLVPQVTYHHIMSFNM